MPNITTTVPEDLYEVLSEMARKDDRTVSSLMRRILKTALDDTAAFGLPTYEPSVDTASNHPTKEPKQA